MDDVNILYILEEGDVGCFRRIDEIFKELNELSYITNKNCDEQKEAIKRQSHNTMLREACNRNLKRCNEEIDILERLNDIQYNKILYGILVKNIKSRDSFMERFKLIGNRERILEKIDELEIEIDALENAKKLIKSDTLDEMIRRREDLMVSYNRCMQ